jgi:hypothetical protein
VNAALKAFCKIKRSRFRPRMLKHQKKMEQLSETTKPRWVKYSVHSGMPICLPNGDQRH